MLDPSYRATRPLLELEPDTALVVRVRATIERLKELRIAPISAAVTAKIEGREEVA